MDTVSFGKSREEVALQLLHLVAFAESKQVTAGGHGGARADREWLLSTYRQCLLATVGQKG